MNRLKELRKANNLTTTDLAHKTGIARSTLSSIESGNRRMNVVHAKILAPFFGVSIDFILGGDSPISVEELNDNLEDVFTRLFDGYVRAAQEGSLDERSRLVFRIVDCVLHGNVSTETLRTVSAYLNNKQDLNEEEKSKN